MQTIEDVIATLLAHHNTKIDELIKLRSAAAHSPAEWHKIDAQIRDIKSSRKFVTKSGVTQAVIKAGLAALPKDATKLTQMVVAQGKHLGRPSYG
jgi:hypothetical protein